MSNWKAQWNIPFRRIVALLLFVALVCPFALSAQPTRAASHAENKEMLSIAAADILQTGNLTDNGDGSYTLSLHFTAKGIHNDVNQSHTVARNSYFTATHDGYYLVELWGGEGAAGESTRYGSGGKGGAGGHVYGVVEMQKGDTLFYTLGGNGVETESTESGGGVNGDGGHHGDTGSYAVGGGGGYSAVFKFMKADNFANTYLDKNGNLKVESILESDRLSKYIMIAGGGGGGGAGDGWSLSEPVGQANGGKGGSMDSIRGTVGAGYYFAGSDGASSGTSVEYVGHGGTNVPGIISDTFTNLGWFDGKQPNDWTGTANTNFLGGSGGSGNLRGGAGGGGFAGGSGGVQTSLLYATNVGGGGGGSSYIDASIYDQTAVPEAQYIGHVQGENDFSSTGGAVRITCLGVSDTSVETQMADFSVSADLSQYFDLDFAKTSVTGAQLLDGEGNLLTGPSDVISVKGDIHASDISVQLVLRRKSNFVGGNYVPLLDSIGYAAGAESGTISLGEDLRYVNVPLILDLTTYSHVTHDVNAEYAAADLFADKSAVWQGMLGCGSAENDFVTVSGYTVNGTPLADMHFPVKPAADGVDPDGAGTYTYTVSYSAAVKNDKVAAVGPEIGAQVNYTQDATITVITGQTVTPEAGVTGAALNLNKTLRYDAAQGKYVLTLRVQGSISDVVEATTTEVTAPAQKKFFYGGTETEYSIPVSGYYRIQAWGGKGGKGEDTLVSWGKGGAGGNGGYVSGYIHLTAGDKLTVQLGANGANGGSEALFNRAAGEGGKYSAVKQSTNYLIVAGGGGGGEKGTVVASGQAGNSGSTTNFGPSSNQPTNLNQYNGEEGKNGGAAAGANYLFTGPMNASLTDNPLLEVNKSDGLFENYTYKNDNNEDVAGGAVIITCLQTDPPVPNVDAADITAMETNLSALLTEFDLSAVFSEYFTVGSVTGFNNNDPNVALTLPQNLDPVAVEDIQPHIIFYHSEDPTTKNVTVTAKCDFSIEFAFTPASGFLGGNDVPVLNSMTLTRPAKGSENGETVPVDPNPVTDYANVEVVPLDPSRLTMYTPTYVLGTGPMDPNLLYQWDYTEPTDWTAAYVNFSGPTVMPAPVQPTPEDDSYTVEVGIEPNPSLATKAVVIPQVSGSTIYKTTTVNVVNQIIYSGLVNMTTSHVMEEVNGHYYYIHPLNTNYSAILTPAPGYILPDTVTVKAGDQTLVADKDYVYYSDTGELLVYADSIGNRNVYISAVGQTRKYSIHFMSADAPALTKSFQYESGADLSAADFTGTGSALEYLNNSAANAPVKEGYTFRWEWEGIGEGESIPTHMPAGNQWVIGSYVANQYSLTIRYINENGEELAPAHTEEIYFGKEYSVMSPHVPGWIPNSQVITGTMGSGNVTVTVTYTQNVGKFTVMYFYKESNAVAAETYNRDIVLNDTVTVSSPTIEGYSPDRDTVHLTVSTEDMVNTGVVEYVYYTPNTYTVSFHSGEGATAFEPMDVQFGKAYGYFRRGGDAFAYGALPTPVKAGSTFKGWLLDGVKVTETDLVTTPTDHTLVAEWELQSFTVTVDYVYGNGTKAAESVVKTVPYGDPVTIDSPTIEGFMADLPTVSIGSMGNQNQSFTVTYRGNPHTLTIRYLDSDGNPFVNPETGETYQPVTETVRYKDLYSYLSPAAPEGYACSMETVSGEMPDEDVTVNVYYRNQQQAEQTQVTVKVTWGELDYLYTHGQWDPETHSYCAPAITPAGDNTIKVENDATSNIYVIANYSYTPRTVYPDIMAYFTLGGPDAPWVTSSGEIANNGFHQVNVWLNGTVDRAVSGNVQIGHCTVSISAGASINNEGG